MSSPQLKILLSNLGEYEILTDYKRACEWYIYRQITKRAIATGVKSCHKNHFMGQVLQTGHSAASGCNFLDLDHSFQHLDRKNFQQERILGVWTDEQSGLVDKCACDVHVICLTCCGILGCTDSSSVARRPWGGSIWDTPWPSPPPPPWPSSSPPPQ